MIGRRLPVVLLLLLAGCAHESGDGQPRPPAPVAPITAGQVADLLSDKAKPDKHPNLFVTVEPEKCAGLAQEVDPPFIFGVTPAAHDGGQWFTDGREFSVQEMVAVYPSDYDPAAAVDAVERTIDACRDLIFTATAMKGEVIDFRLLPKVESSSPQIALWSVEGDWSCDNAFVAAHNAAIEVTACSAHNGYDVQSLAQDALKRIDTLANMAA